MMSRIQRDDHLMYGSLLSQIDKLIYFQPVHSPLVLEKFPQHKGDFEEFKKRSGPILRGTREFDRVQRLIDQTETRIVR